MKNGANKRKVTSNEEISRLLQSSGYLYAEEKVIVQSATEDIDIRKFKRFYEEKYKETFDYEKVESYLENLRLGSDGKLTIAGALLFGQNVEKLIPQFHITSIWYRGNNIENTEYRSSTNLTGTLDELYRKGYDFIVSKLDNVQAGQPFNSIGKLEVPEIVITELLVNALLCKDLHNKAYVNYNIM